LNDRVVHTTSTEGIGTDTVVQRNVCRCAPVFDFFCMLLIGIAASKRNINVRKVAEEAKNILS